MENVGRICTECAEEKLKAFQEESIDEKLKEACSDRSKDAYVKQSFG